jgi:hypothetical protein
MPSFDIVNYSLRPSKSIQRQIVFAGVRELQSNLDLERLVYLGFGSIWFTDFLMAHKLLGVDDMVSIESHEIGYVRAVFNSPYATVRVKHGISGIILPTLYGDEIIGQRPWLIWLDYDYEFNESVRDDVRSLVENAPANSIVIFTFNGRESKYGTAQERPVRLRELFGAVVPDDLSKASCKDEKMQETLANLALDYMQAVAADLSRPGGFIPAVRVIYKDSAPMVTVGGVLPAKGAARTTVDVVGRHVWPCRPEKPIVAPHLTMREATLLQSQLPKAAPLSREVVRGLGFDLDDAQIETFQLYYKQYPAFAQIIA